jgi:hypothetical protein
LDRENDSSLVQVAATNNACKNAKLVGYSNSARCMTNLSSPTRIVWEYFEALRRLVIESRDAKSEATLRQSAALTVVMSVTVVEVFFNLWFRIRAEESHSKEAMAQLVSELGHPRPWSLDKKLKYWPNRYLGRELDLTQGPGAEFMKIKTLRAIPQSGVCQQDC